MRLERYREALAELERSLGHAASEPNARFLRGIIYFQFGEYEESAAELEKVRDHPRFAEPALYRLTEAYRHSGRVEASQETFAELNARYPESPFVHQLMGIAYDSMHRPEDAVREFEAALKANPRLPEAAFGAGYVHFREGNLDEAAKWLDRELQLDVCHAPSLRTWGKSLYSRQTTKKRGKDSSGRLLADAGEPETYLGWGAALERLEQPEAALNLYEKAVAMASDSSDARYRLGRALQSLGRIQEAQAEFERVKQLRARYSQQAARDMEMARGKQR